MTAIKPIENRRVRAVPSERYPLNKISSHPTSTEEATDPHHIFPRSLIKGDSWFVEITSENEDGQGLTEIIVPHVTGLTREEHERVERREAWIKLEDGVYNWYDHEGEEWVLVGPLNPQPGSQEGRPKKRPRLKGVARDERKTVSIRLPEGFDGKAWDDLLEDVEARLLAQEDSPLKKLEGGSAVGKLVIYGLQAYVLGL